MDAVLAALKDNAPMLIVGLVGTTITALWNRELVQRLFVILWSRLARRTKNKLDDEILEAAKESYDIEEKTDGSKT